MKVINILATVIVTLAIPACTTSNSTNSKEIVDNETPVQSTADAKVEKQVSTEDGSRKICKKINVTSSRLNRSKVCKTKAEWDATQDVSKKKMRRLQNKSGPVIVN